MVKFKILGPATEIIGTREFEVKQEKPTKIRSIIKVDDLKEDRYIILVDGKSKNLDTQVSGEDRVVIMPKISGG